METNDLKSFMLVYETGSITQAAKKLFITPQGLSKTIQQMEHTLQAPLFIRNKHGVVPTKSAEYLYGEIGNILTHINQITETIKLLSSEKMPVRFGASSGVFNIVPIDRFSRLLQKNISYREYSLNEVRDMVVSGKLDYGLVVGEFEYPGVLSTFVYGCSICLFVYEGHPFYNLEKINLDMMDGLSVAMLSDRFHIYHEFNDACAVRGVKPKIMATSADAVFLHNLCRKQICPAILPSFMSEGPDMDGIHAIPFEENLRWQVYAIRKNDEENRPEIAELTEILTNI